METKTLRTRTGRCLAAAILLMLPAGAAWATGLNGDEAYTDGPQICGGCHPDPNSQRYCRPVRPSRFLD